MDRSTQTLLTVFIALAALSMLAQAAIMVGVFLGARKAQKKAEALVDDLRLHLLPLIISSREVVQDFAPKLKVVSDNLVHTSTILRAKAEQVGGVVGDVTNRAQAQVSRVDSLVTGTLDQITIAAHAVEHGIAVPIRQVTGILNGLRAGVDVMRKGVPGNHRGPEDDLFV